VIQDAREKGTEGDEWLRRNVRKGSWVELLSGAPGTIPALVLLHRPLAKTPWEEEDPKTSV